LGTRPDWKVFKIESVPTREFGVNIS